MNPVCLSQIVALTLISALLLAQPSLSLAQDFAMDPHEIEYTVSIVAGSEKGFGGDEGPAIRAKLDSPTAVAVDREGNVFIADNNNHRIRKVATNGTITTVAGSGEPGFSGDGGEAIAARLNKPYGVRVDQHGNLLIADQGNERVRLVSPEGIITTVAGNGNDGFGGDGGPAIAASLSWPDDALRDSRGNLYIADAGNQRVRKVSTDGIITTFAGGGQAGYSGDHGPADKAELHCPASLALDTEGNLFIGDLANHAVRKVAKDGTITTVAGTGKAGFSGDGRKAIEAQLNEPGGLAFLSDGSMIIADGANFRIRRVSPNGSVNTIAGTGQFGFSGDGGRSLLATFSVFDIIAVDERDEIFLPDLNNHRIRKLTPIRE